VSGNDLLFCLDRMQSFCVAGAGSIVSERYCLLPGDLRDPKAVENGLIRAGFDPGKSTYVLAECVLVYMEPSESAAVVRWLGSFLTTAACVVYEQVGGLLPDVDTFSWACTGCLPGREPCNFCMCCMRHEVLALCDQH
jgi:O-methyltransferase involved in polyketide biosynthesis